MEESDIHKHRQWVYKEKRRHWGQHRLRKRGCTDGLAKDPLVAAIGGVRVDKIDLGTAVFGRHGVATVNRIIRDSQVRVVIALVGLKALRDQRRAVLEHLGHFNRRIVGLGEQKGHDTGNI